MEQVAPEKRDWKPGTGFPKDDNLNQVVMYLSVVFMLASYGWCLAYILMTFVIHRQDLRMPQQWYAPPAHHQPVIAGGSGLVQHRSVPRVSVTLRAIH